MNAIDAYNQAKHQLEQFQNWKALIGQEFKGGTRAEGGEFGHTVNHDFSCAIYFQEYDGAKNYHHSNELTEPARKAISAAAGERVMEILADAEINLQAAVTEAARKAETIAQEILVEASKF